MPIADGYRKNFQTLQDAMKHGNVCLLECADAKTGAPIVAICAVNYDGKEYEMVPFAKLFDGNPYEELVPPDFDTAMRA